METIYDQPSVPMPEGYHWLLSDVWIEIKKIGQKIKALQGRLMPEFVLQAAEHEDVKVQSEENSSPQDPENQQPKNISEILEKPRDVKRLQSDGRDDSFTGSRLRNRPTATKNISKKQNTNGQGYLLIALAFCTLPPGAYGDSDPVPYHTPVNHPVNLPAGAKVEDIVVWSLSPAHNSAEYFTIYASDRFGEIPRNDGCGGYHFGLNHSIFITSAQPCHAGTYNVEIRGVDSRTMDLIVDDVAKNSTERAKGNETLVHSTPTPASNTDSKSDNTVLAVVTTICCLLALAIVVTIILYLTWKRKRNFNKVPAGGNSGDVSYDQVRHEEDVEAT